MGKILHTVQSHSVTALNLASLLSVFFERNNLDKTNFFYQKNFSISTKHLDFVFKDVNIKSTVGRDEEKATHYFVCGFYFFVSGKLGEFHLSSFIGGE